MILPASLANLFSRYHRSHCHSSSAPSSHLFLFLELFAQEGGIQSYVQDILHAYGSITNHSQCDVFLLRDRPQASEPFQIPAVTFHFFQSTNAAVERIRFAIALFLYLLQRRPSHVFCGHILLSPLVQVLCRLCSIPYTILTYGKEVWEPLPSLHQQALHHAATIWTISRYTSDRLRHANQVTTTPIHVLPCTINENRFTPGPKPPALLQRYGLSTGTKILVTVARLWSGDIYKGVDVTLRALPRIQRMMPNVCYLVIGRGDDQPRLANLAQELGVNHNVIFAGFIPNEELRDHYRLADVYVMPSQEGFGIVYLEAMTCGIPVISGDADGSADPLQDSRVGWRVPHRNPEAVAEACIAALQGDDQRCNGPWLRQEAIARFGQSQFKQTLQSLFLDLEQTC